MWHDNQDILGSETLGLNPSSTIISSMTLVKVFNICEPQFPLLQDLE